MKQGIAKVVKMVRVDSYGATATIYDNTRWKDCELRLNSAQIEQIIKERWQRENDAIPLLLIDKAFNP